MSLFLFNDPFEYCRPSRLPDQHFGQALDPEDLFAPLVPRELRHSTRCPAGYLRPWRTQASHRDAGSTVCCDEDEFRVNLDVQQFKPDEISVKVNENTITVEGKHEEREDEHGLISRRVVRKYVVPRGHNVDKVESRLSSDGVLTVTAPKIEDEKKEERRIPVVQTGLSSKAVEKNEEKKNEK